MAFSPTVIVPPHEFIVRDLLANEDSRVSRKRGLGEQYDILQRLSAAQAFVLGEYAEAAGRLAFLTEYDVVKDDEDTEVVTTPEPVALTVDPLTDTSDLLRTCGDAKEPFVCPIWYLNPSEEAQVPGGEQYYLHATVVDLEPWKIINRFSPGWTPRAMDRLRALADPEWPAPVWPMMPWPYAPGSFNNLIRSDTRFFHRTLADALVEWLAGDPFPFDPNEWLESVRHDPMPIHRAVFRSCWGVFSALFDWPALSAAGPDRALDLLRQHGSGDHIYWLGPLEEYETAPVPDWDAWYRQMMNLGPEFGDQLWCCQRFLNLWWLRLRQRLAVREGLGAVLAQG